MGPAQTSIACEDLASFAARLHSICKRGGLGESEILTLIGHAVRAQCAQCAMALSAQDLLTLAKPTAQASAEEPKISRLRSGYCARKGCDSHFYEFSFQAVAGLDWSGLLDRAEEVKQAEADQDHAEAELVKAQARSKLYQPFRRVAAGIAVVAILLLVRHWRSGGAIPFLRPLDQLQLDPTSTLIDGVCQECGQVHSKTNPPPKKK